VAPRIPCHGRPITSPGRPPAETHILCAGECAVCPPFRLLSFLLSPFHVWDERAKESPIPAAIVQIRVQPEGRGPPCVRIESQRSPKRHGVFVTSATQLALTTTRSVTGTGGTFLLHVPRRRHLHQTLPVPSPRPITRTRISEHASKRATDGLSGTLNLFQILHISDQAQIHQCGFSALPRIISHQRVDETKCRAAGQ
jgi:hypothetical protein